MRLALTLPSLAGGGAQRVLMDLARGFLDRSIDVDIVLVRSEGSLRAIVPTGARLVELGGKEVSLAAVRLARYLRDRRPDTVLSAITHMNLCAVLASRLVHPRVPVVVAEHNHLTSKARHGMVPQDRLLPLLTRVGYPCADGVVAVSQGVADDLATASHLPRHRVQVVYNPIDYERVVRHAGAPVGHPWLIQRSGPVLVAAGRLTYQKGFDVLLRALARLGEDVRLVILGEGPLRRDMERLARALRIDKRVSFAGYVRNPYPSYRAADAVVLSSRWEGLPTVLIEALFLETPVVSADCPSGPAEILEKGRFGRLVQPDDPEALARAIDQTLSEERRPADPVVRERFGVERAVQSYVDVVAQAMASRRQRGRALVRA